MEDAMYVALLRGINVGGKNKLPMRGLAAIFEGLGCTRVRTYIQSGNVVFQAAETDGLAAAVARRIAGEFGLRVPVILRSGAEMTVAVRKHPFVEAGVPEALLHVAFLADAPSDQAVAALDGERSPGDTFAVVGREVYLRLPGGVARTKLTNAFFDRALGTVSTLRNWKTVRMLAEMAAV